MHGNGTTSEPPSGGPPDGIESIIGWLCAAEGGVGERSSGGQAGGSTRRQKGANVAEPEARYSRVAWWNARRLAPAAAGEEAASEAAAARNKMEWRCASV